MAGRIKGITVEINGDTTKLSKALQSVDKNIKNTQTQLKDVEKLLKLDPTNTELLRQKQKLLADQVKATKEKLDALKNAQKQMDAQGVDKNSEAYMALQREIIATTNSLKNAESAAKNFNASLAKVSAVASKVSEATAKAAQKTKALSTAAAGALTGIVGMAYKAATLSDDLNTMAKQSGFTTAELQKMQYAADRIDVSMETIVGAAQKMTNKLRTSEKTFNELGIATRDLNGNFRSTSDIFNDTINYLSSIENETERDTIAMELFGKSANELAGVIDDGGADIQRAQVGRAFLASDVGGKQEEAGGAVVAQVKMQVVDRDQEHAAVKAAVHAEIPAQGSDFLGMGIVNPHGELVFSRLQGVGDVVAEGGIAALVGVAVAAADPHMPSVDIKVGLLIGPQEFQIIMLVTRKFCNVDFFSVPQICTGVTSVSIDGINHIPGMGQIHSGPCRIVIILC